MVDRRSWIGVGCVLALLASVRVVVAAEGDQLLATLDRPATVTATPGPKHETGQPARIVIIVTGFQPPQSGAVQAVVKAQREGETELEIGRFSIFPNTQFNVAGTAGGERFGFSLPKGQDGGGPLKVTVQLVPLRGEGKGATLQLGGAEIR